MARPADPLDWADELADRLAAGRSSPAGAALAVPPGSVLNATPFPDADPTVH